ncbi:MAG: TraB/GumN family protein, partial [Candidatus Nanohaloarchaea archaeon]|nr:TraB/GumN family protein [Candidatus Nanohaloarchaea archaeon]
LLGLDVDLDEVPGEAAVGEMLLRFRVGFPEMHRVLVEERNDVMADRLLALDREYGDVLAFVGAGHVDGVRQRLAAATESS